MAGALHKFPSQDGAGENKPTPSLRPAVVFESFDQDQARALLDVAQQRLAGAQVLLQFIDLNRDLARHAGVETIGIELVALMEGDRLSRVVDALEESVECGDQVKISTDGLGVLKRIETLLAEASANIRRFTEGDFSSMEIMEAQANRDVDYHRLNLGLEEQRIESLREELSFKEKSTAGQVATNLLGSGDVNHHRIRLDLEEQRVKSLREELTLKEKSAARQAATIAAVKAAIAANPAASVNTVRANILGQSDSSSLWVPLAIFGAIALTAVVIAVVVMEKPTSKQTLKPAQKPTTKKK
jgi:hypothetical protein